MTTRRGIWLSFLLLAAIGTTVLAHESKVLVLHNGLILPIVTADQHISVTPTSVDFGTARVGGALTQTLTVTNVSVQTQTVTVTPDPELAGVSVAPADASFTLAPGAAPRTVTLTYAAQAAGAVLQGAVVVRAQDTGLPQNVVVEVSGRSVDLLVDLRDTGCRFPSDLQCRDIEVLEMLTGLSTLTRPRWQVCNLLDEPVTISRSWVTAPAGVWSLFPSVSPFTLDPPIVGLERPCSEIFTAGGVTPTGDRWNIATIPQSTLAAGTYQGTIATTATLPNGTSQVEETSFLVTFVDSFTDLSVSALDFGTVAVGTSSTRSFTVTNRSISTINGEVSVPSGQGLSLSAAGQSGTRVFFDLAVDGAQTFELTYAPTVEASLVGQAVSVTSVNNWSANEFLSIDLSGGTQTAPPVLVAFMPFTSPSAALSSLPYGQVIVNQPEPFELYVQNVGTTPATSIGFRVGGTLVGAGGCVSTVCLEWKDGQIWRPLSSRAQLGVGERILTRVTWSPTAVEQAPPTPFVVEAVETSTSLSLTGDAVSNQQPLVRLIDSESPERPVLRGVLLDGSQRVGDATLRRRFVIQNLGTKMAVPQLLNLAPSAPCLQDAFLNKCFYATDGESLQGRDLAPGEERELELVWMWSPDEQSDFQGTVTFTNGSALEFQSTQLDVVTKCSGCTAGSENPGTPGGLVAYPDEFGGARGLVNENAFVAGLDIDTVNTSNGNLVVAIPIGTPLAVGPSFTYGLSLVHNSSKWQMRTLGTSYGVRDPLYADWVIMMPFPTNAGLGWNVSLGGELYADPYLTFGTISDWPNRTGDHEWVYVDASGGSHPIGPKDASSWSHAADGSMIRVRGAAPDLQVFVDLPSGLTQTFSRSAGGCPDRLIVDSIPYCYRLSRIEDPFGNWVTITYQGDGTTTPTATVTDLHGRTIKVHYKSFFSPDLTTPSSTDQVLFPSSVARYVDKIDFPATPAADGTPRTATWDFVTSERMVNRVCPENLVDRFGPSLKELRLSMPVLHTLVLPEANAGRYDFTYGNGDSNITFDSGVACKIAAGELTEIQTPAGGRLRYTYGPVATAVGCDTANDSQSDAVAVRRGVRVREEVPADATLVPKRTQRYLFVPEDRKVILSGPNACTRPNTQVTHVVETFGNLNEHKQAGVPHFRHEVFFHNMTKTEHNRPDPVANWRVRDDGLPISKNESLSTLGDFGEKLFLSHLLLDCPTDSSGVDVLNIPASGCTVAKKTYRNYAYKTVPENCSSSSFRFIGCTTLARPLRTERIEAGASWRETRFDDFDGYGHARKATTRSNFGGSQLETWEKTQYFVWRGGIKQVRQVSLDTATMTLGTLPESDPAKRLATSDPWILDLYNFKDSNPDGATRRTNFVFDQNGFLDCTRTHNGLGIPPADPPPDDRDATVRFIDDDGDGRTDWEETLGGYAHAEGGCPTPQDPGGSNDPEYRLRHTYSRGRLATTVAKDPAGPRGSAADVGPLLVDNTIDPATGFVTQRCDNSVAPKLCFDLTYDRVGRLTRDEPLASESRGLRRLFTYVLENGPSRGGKVRVETKDVGQGSPAPTVDDLWLHFDEFGRERQIERRVAMARKDPRVGGSQAWIEQRKWFRGDDQLKIVTGVFDRDLWNKMSPDAKVASRYRFVAYDIQRRLQDFVSPRAAEWLKLSHSKSGDETTRFEPYAPGPSGDAKTTTRTDHLGRPVLVEEDLRGGGVPVRRTSVAYNQGRVTSTRSQDGTASPQSRIQRFDGRGVLVEETLPEKNGSVTYQYDSRGNPTRIEDNGVVLLHNYDAAGRLLNIQQDRDPNSNTDLIRWMVMNSYDDQGRLESATRVNYYDSATTGGYVAEGGAIDTPELWYSVGDFFRYDGLGNVDEKITLLRETRWTGIPGTPGAVGTPATLAQMRGTWSYDGLGRVVETTYPACWSLPGDATFGQRGQLCDVFASANDGDGFRPLRTRNRYDFGDLVATDATDSVAATPVWRTLFDYAYHPSGNLRQLGRYNLAGTRVGYDERLEYAFQAADPGSCPQTNPSCLPELTLPRVGALRSFIEPVVDPTQPNLSLGIYDYNGRGQIRQIDNVAFTGDTSFTYDHLRRLTGFTRDKLLRTYSYDAFDNLLAGEGDYAFSVNPVTNRLASTTPGGVPTYDGRGNLTALGDFAASYDPFGRQTAWWWKESAPPEDPTTDYDYQSLYVYSAAGERVGLVDRLPTSLDGSDGVKVSSTTTGAGDDYTEILLTFHSPGGQPLREYRLTDEVSFADNTTAAGKLGARSYVGRQAVLSEGSDGTQDAGYTLRHITEDHLGNPRYARTFDAAAGTLLSENFDSYLPYGMPDPTEGFDMRIHERFGFAGHEHDRNDDNYRLPRDANSFTTFMKARTYAQHFGRFLSPDPARDSSAWSLYAYAGNDPINAIDPTGLAQHVLLVGDAGLGHHNVGDNFTRAAETRRDELEALGDTVTIVEISTVDEFNDAITSGPEIDGSVVFFGHGTGGALYIGEDPETSTVNANLDSSDVSSLDNSNLGPSCTIELNACFVGSGGSNSLAQEMATQLDREVSAPVLDMAFGGDPTTFNSAPGSRPPSTGPLYMVPNPQGGRRTFTP